MIYEVQDVGTRNPALLNSETLRANLKMFKTLCCYVSTGLFVVAAL